MATTSPQGTHSMEAEFVTRPGQRHRSRELRGAPSWVLEVVSRSSIQKGKKLLRDAYHRGGVEEYWLIDALGEAIDFQILVTQEHSFVAQPIEDSGIASPPLWAAVYSAAAGG